MNHHNTRRHPATQSQSHTHSPSPKRSDHTQSTATSSLSRPQSKTRRSATSASATNRHQLDSKSLLEPSDRLITLSRRVSGEITLLKEAARKENIEVKEYYKDEDEGESEREDVKSDIPTHGDIGFNRHERNCDRLRQVTKRLSKRVNALTGDIRKERVEGKRS